MGEKNLGGLVIFSISVLGSQGENILFRPRVDKSGSTFVSISLNRVSI